VQKKLSLGRVYSGRAGPWPRGDLGHTRNSDATTNFLDEIRKFKGIESDYRLAKVLGVCQQAISNYRVCRTQMNDVVAVRAAHVMGQSPAPLLAQLAAGRAKDPEVAKAWKEMARTLKRVKREASAG
jgi:hypothetical protein